MSKIKRRRVYDEENTFFVIKMRNEAELRELLEEFEETLKCPLW
jgi:hypothetical protein